RDAVPRIVRRVDAFAEGVGMNMRVLGIALVCLSVLALAILFTRVERVTYERETGFRGEARNNRFLAAQRFLERMGRPARKLVHFRSDELLDSATGVLVLYEQGWLVGKQGERALLDWVMAGGALITSLDDEDPLTSMMLSNY